MWFRKSVGGTSSLSATRDDDFYVLDDVGEKLQTIVPPPPSRPDDSDCSWIPGWLYWNYWTPVSEKTNFPN